MRILLSILLIWLTTTSALAFDNQHTTFDRLLKKHVHWDAAGVASKVDYAGFQQDWAAFEPYLDELSAVGLREFNSWSKPARLAFLINAYNAYTIQLILTSYPEISSIKDLGSLFSSPWSKQYFTLLGAKRSLDNIEHDMIRVPGVYDDPRIHFAVVCASIGCPGLRNEAFTGQRLEQQLEGSTKRFLSDSSRNRYNPQSNRLEISRIFDWYGDDFAGGFRDHESVGAFLGDYAEQLSPVAADQQRIKAGGLEITFLNYDWSLNSIQNK